MDELNIAEVALSATEVEAPTASTISIAEIAKREELVCGCICEYNA